MTESTKFRKGEGLPGRILESGDPAWIVNVQDDPNFPRNRLATDLGVKGAFGFPVKIRGETVGVLEFFSNREMSPDERFRLACELMALALNSLRRQAEEDGGAMSELLFKYEQATARLRARAS